MVFKSSLQYIVNKISRKLLIMCCLCTKEIFIIYVRLPSRVGPTSLAIFQIVGRFLNRVPFGGHCLTVALRRWQHCMLWRKLFRVELSLPVPGNKCDAGARGSPWWNNFDASLTIILRTCKMHVAIIKKVRRHQNVTSRYSIVMTSALDLG